MNWVSNEITGVDVFLNFAMLRQLKHCYDILTTYHEYQKSKFEDLCENALSNKEFGFAWSLRAK